MGDCYSTLNNRFSIPGRVNFTPGAGGLPMAMLESSGGKGSVMLHGGHVLSFTPAGAPPVLWVSKRSNFAAGKPIRGGIPVCWPWFGQHPQSADKPMHGFARLAEWEVVETMAPGPDRAGIRLRLTDTPATMELWPHKFCLELLAFFGRELQVSLSSANTGTETMQITAALHTYFSVSDISRVTVDGLAGVEFTEKTLSQDKYCSRDAGPVVFNCEVDRLYQGTGADCLINDPGRGRRVRVAKGNSLSTVVWNPWIEKAQRMPDFGDEEYREMLCVETCKAGADGIRLEPGQSHELTAVISVEPLQKP